MSQIIITIIFLLIHATTDIYKRKIYNILLIPMFLVTLWFNYPNLWEFLIGLIVSITLIVILYKFNFFAGGDAKLLIIIGASVGYPQLIFLFLIIFIVGGLQSLWYKYLLKQNNLPYAVSIFIGYLLFMLYSARLLV